MSESLIKASILSMEDYLRDFLPSLENFCQKCPLQPRPEIVPETGMLYLYLPTDEQNPLIFTLNPMVPKQEQIRIIKMKLIDNYPVIQERVLLRLTAKEVEDLINEGSVSLTEALDKRKELYFPRYKIIRVHHSSQEIDCYDIKKKNKAKFKLTIPLINFLSTVNEGNKEKISESSFKNKRFVMTIR
jgi:hypothetical protein